MIMLMPLARQTEKGKNFKQRKTTTKINENIKSIAKTIVYEKLASTPHTCIE